MKIFIALASALALFAQPISHAGSISIAQAGAEAELDEIMLKALNAYGGASALEKVENSSVTYGKFYPSRSAPHRARSAMKKVRFNIENTDNRANGA